ncbi:hypothetical protein H2O64_11765 [Kordia sp. YSTF-M3]|uniref:Polysaccharide chain length determinant N-terminal domain-containing protein n=1 Tax=Kordia aestuariivivens TaxID=2759037 RepID=A0ABR7Q9V8_9FLAO|nr:hypothetical protein [Kordia aestuariivivens]MBC8755356.1 hypothetical protein [Kordia aestuariivivens]
MSENMQNTPQKSTEVDLGDLFRMMGRAMNRFFAFIRNALLFILDLIIRALIIVRVHVIKFVIVGILSVAIGWFIDSRQPIVFGSDMIVQTNYGSARQLYSNIKYYNGLVQRGDSVQLSTLFGITETQARAIKGVSIEPNVSEIDMLKAYDRFMKETDSINVAGEIDYEKFKRSVDPLNFERHEIGVASGEINIFSLLQDKLIKVNLENDYIKKQKEITLRNLNSEEAALNKRLIKIDTLRDVYNKAIRSEAGKTSQSQTSIQMASSTIKTSELELFSLDEEIAARLLKIAEDKEFKKETINVLSNFSDGAQIRHFYDSYLFRIPIITSLLLFVFILLRELNKYLNTYAENRRSNA